MSSCQPAILEPVPRVARYLFFSVAQPDAALLRQALLRLSDQVDGRHLLVGVGAQLVQLLGVRVPQLHEFVPLHGVGVQVPATPSALCVWVRGDDQGDLVLTTHRLQHTLAPALHLAHCVDAFRHGQGPNGHGRDLTGYEDGTENPQGSAAVDAALCRSIRPGLDGSSCMAVQQWQHDLDAFNAMDRDTQDHLIGRRRSDNEELEDADPSAHVRRTAQEDFEPEAFVLRRSMPWAVGPQCGLMFVAFGHSFSAFEAQMRRMAGLDDGVVDGLFRISKPLSGMHFWCPPLRHRRLDWRALD